MKYKLEVVVFQFFALFKQGLAPKELSQSIIVSILLSTIPILGVSTLLITTISLKRKLNLPLMLSLSYLLWPVQILLIIPFIRVGEFIFAVPRNHQTVEEIIASFQHNFFQAVSTLSLELLCGFGGWFVSAVPIAFCSYFATLNFIKGNKGK